MRETSSNLRILDYKSIPVKKQLLITDELALEGLIEVDSLFVVTDLYDRVYVLADIYDRLAKKFSTTWLLRLEEVSRKNYAAKEIIKKSLTTQHEILSDEEASALICAMTEGYDLMIDDPRKIKIMEGYGIRVIAPAEVLVANVLAKEVDIVG